jgi:hypothetical protein
MLRSSDINHIQDKARSIARALALASLLLSLNFLPHVQVETRVLAQSAAPGRVLAPVRGQVGWLDLLAPRPTLITDFGRPSYVADLAAVASLPFAAASVVQAFEGGGAPGADLVRVDLQSGAVSTLVKRQAPTESIDVPAFWPDGHAVLYQRSNLNAAIPVPRQATPQFRSQIEQLAFDGSGPTVVIDDARYPGPSADASRITFVRSTSSGAAILARSLEDGTDSIVVPPGPFVAIAYPRYSPDGLHIAFAAISKLTPTGTTRSATALDWFGATTASAHGFPWEVWIVNADGTGLRDVPDLLDDDPSITWSPDGSRVLVYGGWGSVIVDPLTGAADSLSYLGGYGSAAWLPVEDAPPSGE